MSRLIIGLTGVSMWFTWSIGVISILTKYIGPPSRDHITDFQEILIFLGFSPY